MNKAKHFLKNLNYLPSRIFLLFHLGISGNIKAPLPSLDFLNPLLHELLFYGNSGKKVHLLDVFY